MTDKKHCILTSGTNGPAGSYLIDQQGNRVPYETFVSVGYTKDDVMAELNNMVKSWYDNQPLKNIYWRIRAEARIRPKEEGGAHQPPWRARCRVAFATGLSDDQDEGFDRQVEILTYMPGIGEKNMDTNGSYDIVLSENSIKIGPASYHPVTVIEAAIGYLQFVIEKDWQLRDERGLEISTIPQIRGWINQINVPPKGPSAEQKPLEELG